MTENAGSVIFKTSVDNSAFKTGINDAANTATSSLGNALKKIGALAVTAFSVSKIISFGKSCYEVYSNAITEETKLTQIMKTRMSLTDDSITQLNDLISAQSELGVVGTTAQKAGAQQMASYLYTTEALEELIPAMNNLAVQQNGATVTAENMTSIANLMGKAMVGNTGALTRAGITFTDAQEAVMKYGTEEERAAMLAQVVNENVGDMNEAIANTPAGALQKLKNNLGGIQKTLGAIINTFVTPFINGLNVIIKQISTIANGLADLLGVSVTTLTEETGTALAGTSSVAEAALEDVEESTDAIERALGSQDELNILSFGDTSDSSDYDADEISDTTSATEAANSALTVTNGILSSIIDEFKELGELFAEGFALGFDGTSFDSIKTAIKDIGTTLKDIFTDKEVVSSVKTLVETIVKTFGTVVGSAASIAVEWTGALLTGISNSLSKNKDTVKNTIVTLCNDWTSIFNTIGDIAINIKAIFTDSDVLASVTKFGESLTTAVIQCAAAFLSIGTTIATFVIGSIDSFIEEHSEDIQDFIINMLDVAGRAAEITGNFAEACAGIFEIFRSDDAQQIGADLINILFQAGSGIIGTALQLGTDVLDAVTYPIVNNQDSIKTALESTIGSVGDVVGSISDLFTNTFAKVQEVYDKYLSPAFEDIKNGFDTIFSGIMDSYNEYMAPCLEWLSDNISSLMSDYIQPMIDNVLEFVGSFIDAAAEFFDFISPIVSWIIDFAILEIVEKIQWMWQIIQPILEIIATAISTVFGVLSGLIDFISGVFTGDWSKAWSGIKKIFSSVFDGIFKIVKSIFNSIVNAIQTTIASINNKVSNVTKFISTAFSTAWTVIKNVFSTVGQFFSSVWTAVKSPFQSVATWFKNIFSDAWTKVKNVFSTGGKIFAGIKEGISSVFKTVVNHIISGINTVIAAPFNAINSMLNTIRNISIMGAHPFKSLWDENPLTVPQIPTLATGGYVAANSPQLAIIGDNKHEGEIVAPESKISEAVTEGLEKLLNKLKGTSNSEQKLTLEVIIKYPDGKTLIKTINKQQITDGKITLLT